MAPCGGSCQGSSFRAEPCACSGRARLERFIRRSLVNEARRGERAHRKDMDSRLAKESRGSAESSEGSSGVWLAAVAYLLCGLLQINWKLLRDVSAGEVMADRMVWSLAVVLGLLALQRRWAWMAPAVQSRRVMLS